MAALATSVRRGSLEDADAVYGLRQRIESWMVQRGIDQWEMGGRSLTWYRRSLASDEWWVSPREGAIRAVVRVAWRDPSVWRDLDDDALYVHDLMADPTQAGKGMGARLLDWVENLAVDRGVAVARLDCMEENTALVDYYRTHGFGLVARGQEPYPHRGRLAWAVLMEKSLATPAGHDQVADHSPKRISAAVGLRRGTVEIHAYHPAWPEEFRRERDRLAQVLGQAAVVIEHVGSTSVPGLSAKPLIDILVAVNRLPALDGPEVLALQGLGYRAMPDRVYPKRLFMPKGPEERRTHHLHLVLAATEEWSAPIRFRDALRADDALRDEYDELKRSLAVTHADDRVVYSDLKAGFIRDVLHAERGAQ